MGSLHGEKCELRYVSFADRQELFWRAASGARAAAACSRIEFQLCC